MAQSSLYLRRSFNQSMMIAMSALTPPKTVPATVPASAACDSPLASSLDTEEVAAM